jgi:hypothetical protein
MLAGVFPGARKFFSEEDVLLFIQEDDQVTLEMLEAVKLPDLFKANDLLIGTFPPLHCTFLSPTCLLVLPVS